jgi:hypothetical protein
MKKLLIALIVVVGLLIGADFGARAIAETQATNALAQRTEVNDADVDIHGFPFLTQALSGHYKHVTVTASDVELNRVSAATTIDAYDVYYPLSDAIDQNVETMTTDRAVVTLRVPMSSIATVLNRPGVTVAAAGDQVQITTTVTIAGRQIPVSATASVSVSDGTLHLKPSTVSFGSVDTSMLPQSVQDAAIKALTFAVPLDGLPVKVQSAQLSVDGSDLAITAEVHDVVVADLVRPA